MISITESKMVFGPFEDNMVFEIEKSNLHQHIGDNVKTVEFILRTKSETLSFVEAKSSSPRPSLENTANFQTFIDEITQKFLHSFDLYYSAVWGRHKDFSDLTESFSKLDHADIVFNFVLVIKGHKIEWLPPVKVALEKALIAHGKIWNSRIVVLNDELAKQYKLVNQVIA